MYSIIQKSVEESDERIMILGGNSHIAMFKEFIDYNPEWKPIELKDILKWNVVQSLNRSVTKFWNIDSKHIMGVYDYEEKYLGEFIKVIK